MIRVNNKSEIIKEVQTFLRRVNPEISVALSGVFDDNTKLSVMSFQKAVGLKESGIVNKETFDLLYERYIFLEAKDDISRHHGLKLNFPIFFGDRQDGLIHINGMIANVLDYYGIDHRININEFYSKETSCGVMMLKKIFLMETEDYIDESFYSRMIDEINSISEFKK